jgi:hypothetical protein
MQNIKIDAEFQRLIPPLTDEEFKQLTINILADGCLDPLVIWKGHDIILDGHNRYRIVKENNLPFNTTEIDLPDRIDAKIWIHRHQLGRRNLTNFQLIEQAAALKPLIAAKAKENQKASLGAGKKGISDLRDLNPILTDEELAKAAGVSTGALYGGMRVINKGVPELQDMAREKRVGIKYAAEIAALPKEEQKRIVEKGPDATKAKAREIITTRRQSKHQVPLSIQVPKDTKGNPMPQATEAMQFAVIAISQLTRVRADDPGREEALNRVKNWIDKKLQEWKGTKA